MRKDEEAEFTAEELASLNFCTGVGTPERVGDGGSGVVAPLKLTAECFLTIRWTIPLYHVWNTVRYPRRTSALLRQPGKNDSSES